MAYAPYSGNAIQLGAETTAGTAVAADIKWRGPATDIADGSEHVMVEQDVGLMAPVLETYQASQSATLSMPETEMDFEHLPHILEAGIKTATPTGGGPYVYVYPLATTAQQAIKTYTIETGNLLENIDEHEMAHSFVESFSLSGSHNEAWMMGAEWRGARKVGGITMTAALALAAREIALFNNTALAIDDGGGTMGSTAVTGVLRSFNLDVETGIKPVPVGDGNLYYSTLKYTKPSATFSMTLELEDGSSFVEAERDAFEAGTVRLIELTITGTSDREILIEMAGKYLSAPDSYENDDGNTVVTFNGTLGYSSADSEFLTITVTNNLTALP